VTIPTKACGIVAGPVGSDDPTRHIPMDNAARSMTFYEFDSKEYLRVWREMDDLDEEPVVIYHSHTATEAYPSRTTSASPAGRRPTICWCRPVTRTPPRCARSHRGK
jgi:proteasome lid subunit RPN8/RPN11